MYNPIKIVDFLHRKKEPIKIEFDKEYSLVTVKLHHKGVVLREKKKGSLLGSNMYKITKGQFILSGIDARNGAFGIVPDKLDGAIVTNDFWYFDVDETRVKRDFFYWLTNTPLFLDACQKSSKGETQRIRLQKDLFFNFEFHFPPIDKQEDFLNRFLIIEKSLSALKDEQTNQSSYFSFLRQSILQEAIEGKLTDYWRKKNPSRKGDPEYDAHALLEKIKEEKGRMIAEGKIKKQKPLEPIKPEEVPFTLPEGWAWCRLPQILDSGDSLRRGPFGSSITKAMFISKSSRATKIYEQKNAIYKDYTLGSYYIDLNEHLNLKNFITGPGDIIISCAGTIGETYLLPKDATKGIINQALLKIRLNERVVNNQYFMNVFKAQTKSRINEDAKGTAMKNISSVNYLKNDLVFPLAPLAEQRVIVERVDHLLGMIDELEQQVADRKERAEELLQSVLREAFEGR